MKQFLTPRSKIYQDLISKYDVLDKEFPMDTNAIDKLKVITLLSHIINLNNKSFSTLVNKEFSTSRKVKLTPQSKQKFGITKFLLTLRSLSLYLYLDIFIHTYLNNKSNLLNQTQNYFTFVLYQNSCNSFFTPEFLFNLDNYSTSNQKTLISLFFPHVEKTNIHKQLNYYFIPSFTNVLGE